MLKEAMNLLFENDLPTAKITLREFINGTIGFTQLGKELQRSPKSLMRMFGPLGNPQLTNFFAVLSILQRKEGIRLQSQSVPAPAKSRKAA